MSENTKITHYKDLKIWQKGMALVTSVYRLTNGFPPAEKYGLVSLLRRAAISVPSNIAEGQARSGPRKFLQFLSHASGSLAELETQLLLSVDLGYCQLQDTDSIVRELVELQKMLAAIRRKLSRQFATSHSSLAT